MLCVGVQFEDARYHSKDMRSFVSRYAPDMQAELGFQWTEYVTTVVQQVTTFSVFIFQQLNFKTCKLTSSWGCVTSNTQPESGDAHFGISDGCTF